MADKEIYNLIYQTTRNERKTREMKKEREKHLYHALIYSIPHHIYDTIQTKKND